MINESLKKYIEEVIFPQYELNDMGHNINHIMYVIDRSLKFASEVEDINLDMVYTIAAYHDIGHHIDAKNHEVVSAKILGEDEKLKEYFTKEEIEEKFVNCSIYHTYTEIEENTLSKALEGLFITIYDTLQSTMKKEKLDGDKGRSRCLIF